MVCNRICCDFLSSVNGRVCEKGFEEEVVEVPGDESEKVEVNSKRVCFGSLSVSILMVISDSEVGGDGSACDVSECVPARVFDLTASPGVECDISAVCLRNVG